MTEEEIYDGNKIIADFMGHKYPTDTKMAQFLFRSVYLKYNFSWNALMPVIENIENLLDEEGSFAFSVDFGRDYCIIRHNDFTYRPITARSTANNKLESCWLAVVNFIEWYNSKNKTT